MYIYQSYSLSGVECYKLATVDEYYITEATGIDITCYYAKNSNSYNKHYIMHEYN